MSTRIPKTLLSVLAFSLIAATQTIPAGTKVTVRIGSEISSGSAKVGDRFEGSLTHDLVVDGKTIAKSGSTVHGKVTSAKSSGRLHAPGQLSIRLTSVTAGGKTVPLSTGSYHVEGKGHAKSNTTKIGGGAAAGAIIGAIAGGGKGAAIGAGAGAAAGTGVAAATGKEEAVIPAEKSITFTTTAAPRRSRIQNRLRTGVQPVQESHYAAPFKYSSTCSACPSGFTLLNTCLIFPSGPMMKVVRAMPITFLPYMFFSL